MPTLTTLEQFLQWCEHHKDSETHFSDILLSENANDETHDQAIYWRDSICFVARELNYHFTTPKQIIDLFAKCALEYPNVADKVKSAYVELTTPEEPELQPVETDESSEDTESESESESESEEEQYTEDCVPSDEITDEDIQQLATPNQSEKLDSVYGQPED